MKEFTHVRFHIEGAINNQGPLQYKSALVAPRTPKGRPQGCILGVRHPKLKNDILNLKMGFLTQNISADMGFRCFRWAGGQVDRWAGGQVLFRQILR